ncbi:hypothetical protein V8C86DRAFT_3031474 [Haematococcus lacustris]
MGDRKAAKPTTLASYAAALLTAATEAPGAAATASAAMLAAQTPQRRPPQLPDQAHPAGPRGQGVAVQLAASSSPIQQPGRAVGVLMCSPAGHANLLTSLADPAWRAVRKAVAVAFSLQNIKKKYPVIRSCSERLIGQLAGLAQSSAAAGRPDIVVDVDQAALRVTLDVIGLAGFGHDYRSVYQGSDCTQPAPPTHLLRILPRCFTEARLPCSASAPAA